jgi:hypothetical protein
MSMEGMARQIERWLHQMRVSRYPHADRIVFATILLHQVLRAMPKRDRPGGVGLVLDMIREEYPEAGVVASAALFAEFESALSFLADVEGDGETRH